MAFFSWCEYFTTLDGLMRGFHAVLNIQYFLSFSVEFATFDSACFVCGHLFRDLEVSYF